MDVDLGAWSPAEAAALARILRARGIEAACTPVGDAVHVTVPAGEADAAHRAMAESMDELAALHPSAPTPRSGRSAPHAPVKGAARARAPLDDEPPGRPLFTERLLRLAPLLAVVVAALMVTLLVPGPLRLAVAPLAALTIIWFAVRRE